MLLDMRSRRDVLKGLLLAGSAIALFGVIAAAAQQPADTPMKVPQDEMMAPGALPDVVQGKADAPVTIVEYASMTCPHCAHFHATVYPWLVKTYVDTGKVKFILREFPLDPSGRRRLHAGALRGAGQAQRRRRPAIRPAAELGLHRQAARGAAQFAAADRHEQGSRSTPASRTRSSRIRSTRCPIAARRQFGVNATPTFFVNGEKVTGEVTEQSLAKILDPLVAKKS